MSALTKKEREGLEEVYISLNKSNTIYQKTKTFFILWSNSIFFSQTKKPLKNPKYGNITDKFWKKSLFFIKLKKFLSK